MIGCRKRLFCTHSTWPNSMGAERMELAKMMGITPPEFTFNGKWLDWPPIMRRPTMRRALWMGMRRSLRSTKTMKATTAAMPATSSSTTRKVIGPQASVWTFWTRSTTPRGRPATMPAKISRLMPLPMPRSVICSPSHMMNAVPAVSVSTVIRMNPAPDSAPVPAW